MKEKLLLPVFEIFQKKYPEYLGFHKFKDAFDAHFNINDFLETNNCEINNKVELNADSLALENMTMVDILKHISSKIITYVVDHKNVVQKLDPEEVEIHDISFYLHRFFEDGLLKNKVLVNFTIRNAVVKEDAGFKYRMIHYSVRKYLEKQQSDQILAKKDIKPFLEMTTDEFNTIIDTGFIEPSIVKALRAERQKQK
mgnify:FL=1